jgi:hypothetical protein
MKKLNYPIIAAVAGLLIASAGQVRAGGTDACCSSTCCHDNIAASPKVRTTINERCESKCTSMTHGSVTTTTITPQTAVAGSPKVQQMQSERASTSAVQVTPETAVYRATGPDGVTASPKVRATLDDRKPTVEIAPLK